MADSTTKIQNFINENDISGLIKYFKGKNHINHSFFNDNKNIINDLIKNGNNKILKIIFIFFKFNNDFIIALILNYKNKTLTYSELKRLLTEENNKITITNDMYDLAFENNNYMALKILFENEIITKESNAIRRIIKYNLIENSIRTKDYNFVKKILNYKDFNFKNLKYEKILITAFENSKTINSTSSDNKIAKLLIKSLLKSPYSSCTYKNSILNIAIEKGNFDLVKYLIENEDFKYTKEEINSKDLKGHYPIIEAISNKKFEIFNYLLEKGADYNKKNNNGVPLLFLALHLNDIEYIISLVNDKTLNKIKINILDNNGYTPLITSYTNKYMDIFNYLIEYSDVNKKDKYGHSILYYVIQNGDKTNVRNLISIGTKFDEDILNVAIKTRNISIILEYDDIPLSNYKGENGESFLIVVILNSCHYPSDPSNIEKIIIKGCDVNVTDKEGNTPLICAVKKNNASIAELLIKYGAIKDMKNFNGKTASDYIKSCRCISECYCGFQELCRLFYNIKRERI